MFLEEFRLFVGRVAPQHLVAMREAPEAFNDIMMLPGKAERKLVAQLFIKVDTALLVAQMFAMHERKIEELALVGRQLPVEIMIERLCRYVSSQPVAFERAR